MVEIGWLQVKSRAGRYGENLYSVPSSSDSRNEKTYATKTMLLGITEQTEARGIGQNELSLNELGDRSKRTHDGVKMNWGIGQNELLKDNIRYKDKKTITIEEVFNCEETEENPIPEIVIPEKVIPSGDTSDTTEEDDLLSFLQEEYQAVLNKPYTPKKREKAQLRLLSEYPISEVKKVISQVLSDLESGRLSYFTAGILLDRLQRSGIQPNPKEEDNDSDTTEEEPITPEPDIPITPKQDEPITSDNQEDLDEYEYVPRYQFWVNWRTGEKVTDNTLIDRLSKRRRT